MATNTTDKIFCDELSADIAAYSRQLHEQRLNRHKLTITQISEQECHLELLYFNRREKIEITGRSVGEVMTAFFNQHAEDMFGLEFVVL